MTMTGRRGGQRGRLGIAGGLLLVPLWFVVACADSGDDAPPALSADEPVDEPVNRPTSREERIDVRRRLQADQIPEPDRVPESDAEPVIGEAPRELVDAILADVAKQSGADTAALEVVQAEARRWNSGALGCPEPGQMYTQAIVDGYQVVIGLGGDRYDYRATADGYFRLCRGPDSPRM